MIYLAVVGGGAGSGAGDGNGGGHGGGGGGGVCPRTFDLPVNFLHLHAH